MSRIELSKIVQSLDHQMRGYAARLKKESYIPILQPPASPSAILALEKRIGLALPGFYRDLLEVINGARGLVLFGNLLSLEQTLPPGRVKVFPNPCPQCPKNLRIVYECVHPLRTQFDLPSSGGKPLEILIIGEGTQGNEWLYLDPTNKKDGSWKIVRTQHADDNIVYSSLMEFFEEELKEIQDLNKRMDEGQFPPR